MRVVAYLLQLVLYGCDAHEVQVTLNQISNLLKLKDKLSQEKAAVFGKNNMKRMDGTCAHEKRVSLGQ